MGQYHLVVNLDKKEFVDPHKLGCGLKLWEQLANHPSTGSALIVLLACSNGRGGGDLRSTDPADTVGHWAGDRIAIVGDYGEPHDLPAEFQADKIYGQCRDGSYRDITDPVSMILENELQGKFEGEGWKKFVSEL